MLNQNFARTELFWSHSNQKSNDSVVLFCLGVPSSCYSHIFLTPFFDEQFAIISHLLITVIVILITISSFTTLWNKYFLNVLFYVSLIILDILGRYKINLTLHNIVYFYLQAGFKMIVKNANCTVE